MQTSYRHTVPASYVRGLLSQVIEQGYDTQEILDYVGISTDDIRDAQDFPAELFSALYQRVMYIAQDEYFGMISVGKVPNGTFRMMCLSIIHSKSLREAAERGSDFHEICRGARIKPCVLQQGEEAVVSYMPLSNSTREEYQSAQAFLQSQSPANIITSLSMWHHFISWLIGERVQLNAVRFRFPAGQALPYCRTRFRAEIAFEQQQNAFSFPAHYLDYPILQTEKSLEAFLKTAPYQLIVMIDSDQSKLSKQVASLIGRDFSMAPPTAEQVARTLNMSVSTLRRRLQEEDTSFQVVKDDCRRKTALDYMHSPQLSIGDVAELMGFDEPSAFFRSFKRWTGMTPGEYRQSDEYRQQLERPRENH